MSIAVDNEILTNSNAASSSYGITEWPDTDDLYKRLAALVRQPMRPIRRENMELVLRYFTERCAASQRLSQEATRVIPGGIQHNLAFNYPFPLSVAEANGAYLTDVDGNR